MLMAPRETENNAYAKFWGDKQRTLWYVMVFSGEVNFNLLPRVLSLCHSILGMRDESTKMVKFNAALSQILSKVFFFKNMSLELTKYCCVFTSKFSDDNTECYSNQCVGS